MTTKALPLQALNHAVATGKDMLDVLVHHNDHGNQYVSIAYHERLRVTGRDESTGRVEYFYVHTLAETANGLYKRELIYSRTRDNLAQVERVTLRSVYW